VGKSDKLQNLDIDLFLEGRGRGRILDRTSDTVAVPSHELA
jgi:hypothetical protein